MKSGGNARLESESKKPPEILQRGFDFAVEIVTLCGKLDERPGVGRVMMSQILRAGTNAPANVEEVQAGQSKEDLINKMSVALKEARKRASASAFSLPRTVFQPGEKERGVSRIS
jgi:hypothetical protein